MMQLRSLSLVLLLATAAVVAAQDCDTKGKTVLVKGQDDQTATVVHADCTETTLKLSTEYVLDASKHAIEQVKSLPAAAKVVDLGNNSLSAFPALDTSDLPKSLERLVLNLNKIASFKDVHVPSSVKMLDLSWNALHDFEGVETLLSDKLTDLFIGGNAFTSLAPVSKLSGIKTLYIHDVPVQTFKDVTFPESVQLLNLMNTSLSSFDDLKLPSGLTQLDVSNNKLRKFPTELPSELTGFKADYNKIASLENFKMQGSITKLDLSFNPLKSIVGVQFPWTLKSFNLKGTEVTEFEISRQDVPTFQQLALFADAKITQKSCKNTQAQLLTILRQPLCVLETEVFNKLYSGNQSPSGSNTSDTSSSKRSWVGPVVGSLCGVIALVLLVIGIRAYRIKQRRIKQPMTLADTLLPGGTGALSGTGSQQQLNNTLTFNSGIFSQGKNVKTINLSSSDISQEVSLLKYRIAANEILVEKALAKGGFGIVYLAQYQQQPVVVKKILPEKASDDRCLKGFLDEIKLCSTLDHPKIVKFLGVSWNTLADISVIMEFMPNGDLDTLLKRQMERKRRHEDEFDWYQTVNGLPSKAQIALDILDAVVYLHSFSSPIIHRDLKAKNVLLSDRYEAKLSDFGVSREWAVDQTMTAGIGTMAWIAPEVLRGERYTEKADMYSFGVLLTELSTYQKPFEGVTNALIVLKVTSGEDQPDLGRECPEDIRELGLRCLSYHASDRPSAMVAHYELKTLLKLHTAFEL